MARETGSSHRNRVRLLHDGCQVLPAMLEAIKRAEHEVLLEMYWFASDAVGLRFADSLMERAKAGLTVRVIYDAVGSIEAEDAMFDAMRRAGVEVFEFNPIAPWRARFSFARINRRNHRKLLVVDGKLAITGGVNLGNPWAPKHEGGGGFRDDAIEVVGEAAGELRLLFHRSFPGPLIPLPPPKLPPEQCHVTVLASDLRAERRGIYDGYLNAIARANREVIICNSYFIPTRPVRRSLARAVSRGVRVRVLVPRDTDVKVAQLASRHLYARLLRAGVEINEWVGGILHSKTAIVDDDWCTVGSFNFDTLSIQNNLELNIAVGSAEINRALRERVEQDFASSTPIDLESLQRRSLLIRLVERFVYAFRWLL